MFLVDSMLLTFEVGPHRKRDSNVKINPLVHWAGQKSPYRDFHWRAGVWVWEDARSYHFLPVPSRLAAIERHSGGTVEPAEACLTNLYRAAQQQRSWHLGHHDSDGQVEDLRGTLAGRLYPRRRR